MARRALMLNKQHWNAVRAGSLNQCGDSCDNGIEGSVRFNRSWQIGDGQNIVLNVDHNESFVLRHGSIQNTKARV